MLLVELKSAKSLIKCLHAPSLCASLDMACLTIEIGWRSEGPFVLVTKWQLQPMALLYETLRGHFMNFDFMEEHKLTPPT